MLTDDGPASLANLTPNEASLLHHLTQHCAASPDTIAEGPWKAW
ncbi:MAG: hypothetical protein ACJA1L_000078 [Paracoccaceae bacterium]|jgi:hypothetical protein